ncbi:hypothetical protein NC653_018120 [Populus alba x Populus x berolinensis]|uniref:Uncharacterized protein n=1 Tax=Populus alba x Populus x berolinensis TaxID=444605 RepID=A0AAD6QS95_9ROSI|nr:hypothetical protein NC653_018120 [Populus alba x Populus x berolinensis]
MVKALTLVLDFTTEKSIFVLASIEVILNTVAPKADSQRGHCCHQQSIMCEGSSPKPMNE